MMITYKDQDDLFKKISDNLKKDVECYAFGGTAMMFYGYKDDTKDIDLLFNTLEDRSEFIKVLENFGYEEFSPVKIYTPEKLRDEHKPVMYKIGDSRFDLFVKKIFHTVISPKMKEDIFAVHEFRGRHKLAVNVLRKEHLVLLKGVTERDKDFEDILTIIRKDKDFDWQYFIDEVIWQFNHGDKWVLIDAEKMMKELKKYIFIEEKYFKQIYKAADKIKK